MIGQTVKVASGLLASASRGLGEVSVSLGFSPCSKEEPAREASVGLQTLAARNDVHLDVCCVYLCIHRHMHGRPYTRTDVYAYTGIL